MEKLVSIIIPCYNGHAFIGDTLRSVLAQTYPHFEILVLNDGSTDNTEEEIRRITDPRITYLSKSNTGVSDTRNRGMALAKGDYILFLDADDILSETFIQKRVESLNANPSFGFCTSYALKIDEQGNQLSTQKLKGAAANIKKEVLTFDPEIITCPSNYLIRKNLLDQYSVRFDTDLSSSADRYFLVQLSDHTLKGLFIEDSILYYRVHKNSMSNNFTSTLLDDNLLFQKKIMCLRDISKEIRREFYFKSNYILAGSFFKLRNLPRCMFYSLKAFYFDPLKFIKKILTFK